MCDGLYTRACMRVSEKEREKKWVQVAIHLPPTRLAAKTSAGEFV